MGTQAIRGAISVENNTEKDIIDNTMILLETIIQRNSIDIKNIVSIIFTATSDLNQAYPAIAARRLNITEAALLCMQEMMVVGSLNKCIRVLLQVESSSPQSEAKHVYLKDAIKLRPDLCD